MTLKQPGAMSRPWQSASAALGWTTLALTGLIEPMVGRGRHLALYHWDGSVSALFGPVLLLFFAVWGVSTALLWSAAHPGRWRAYVWGALVLFLPWLLVNALDQLMPPLPWLRVATFFPAAIVLAVYLIAWRPRMEPRVEVTVRQTSRLLHLLAFSGALCLVQLLWFWWSARNLNASFRAGHETVEEHPPAQGRVIWIVFDELSQRQLFEARFPGLLMPAFDALAAQSAVWTHVVPAGSKTDLVLPSLITGKPVAAIRASSSGQLLFRERESSPWEIFSQRDTVFQDARNAGYSTGVVGWYNPYCRLMPDVLDHCFWRMYTELDNGLGSDESFAANVRHALGAIRAGGLRDPAMTGMDLQTDAHNLGAQGHLDDYQQLLAHAERLLADRSAGFVLLHMPVPHPGGIFDRHTGQFALGHTSYVDNLALADRCLAALRAALESTGDWDRATVVVMGDHSWRTGFMWRRTPAQWTAEDEMASHGGEFDDRPAYMVKLPSEQASEQIGVSFDAVRTRRLLDGLLSGRWTTPGQLAGWAGQSQAGR